MKRPLVKFIVSKQREAERLVDLFAGYKWFVDNDFPIILPKISQSVKNDLFKKQSKKKLLFLANKILENEYNKDKYLQAQKITEREWAKVEGDFFDVIKKYQFRVRNKFFCYISLYGPMGQFFYPSIIDVRATKQNIKSIGETVAHEIIHLMIFNKVKKLKLSYEEVENIVDLFFIHTELKKIFPKYQLQNSIKHSFDKFNSFIN